MVELFAGVGGFRIGLEGAPGSGEEGAFRVVWANQWEPSTKAQHAAQLYADRWGLEPTDEDEAGELEDLLGDLEVSFEVEEAEEGGDEEGGEEAGEDKE